MDIDLVYLWVNGNDPAWQAKRQAFIGGTEEDSATNCKGRYVDNDELKYSLRSVEKYLPWIRKIYIVTDDQTPDWLDTSHPKIEIVDHKVILPKESLPCFNSSLIEKFIYRIPGLSERFLLANDDTFVNNPLTPEDFFDGNGFPIIRLTRKRLRRIRWIWRERIRKKPLHNHSRKIANASELVKARYGKYYTGLPHHNIDAYLRSDCKRVVENLFFDVFAKEFGHHMRNQNDTHRIIYYYIALFEKRGCLRYVSDKESLHVHIHKDSSYQKLERYKPTFFCMNDSQYAQDSDRERAKVVLETLFPEKSQYEL
ncbi:Stealth CR1 domain-containing protein [Bacteroidales bacterium OttesenSCG-928-M11]|nr:Stealth CR1 domain-containing protein [Bacteroidales bacterium OttesenSCG-928-M11]